MTAGEPRWNQSGTLFEGIECWSEGKASLTHDDVIDDPKSRFLEVLAAEALKLDYGSRVTASHTFAMGSYNDHYCSRLFRLLKKSGLHFLSMPTESLHLQGRFDGYPKRRGLTRVPELLATLG